MRVQVIGVAKVLKDGADYSKVVLGILDDKMDFGFRVETYRTTASVADVLLAVAARAELPLVVDASIRVQRFGDKVFESVTSVSPYREPIPFDL